MAVCQIFKRGEVVVAEPGFERHLARP
jgi:hypothetical protein